MPQDAGKRRAAFMDDRMRLRTILALAGMAAAGEAAAADLFGAAPPVTYPATKAATLVEAGSNWYIRGDVGVSLDNAPSISIAGVSTPPPGYLGSTFTGGTTGYSTDFAGGVGFGYRFNDYLRLDATWEYRNGPSRNRSLAAICPYGLVGINDPNTGARAGFLYDTTNTCVGSLALRQHNNTVLANAYVDLGTYSGFTPYVGGGLGLNVNSMQASSNFSETANGLGYAADLSPFAPYPPVWVNAAGQPIAPQPAIAFAPQNWNRTIESTKYNFAFALAAGVGFQLNPSATLDVGYRYLNAGTSTLLINPQTGLSVRQRNDSQEIRAGVRYVLQ